MDDAAEGVAVASGLRRLRPAAGLVGVVAALLFVLWILGRGPKPDDSNDAAASNNANEQDADSDDNQTATGDQPEAPNTSESPTSSQEAAGESTEADQQVGTGVKAFSPLVGTLSYLARSDVIEVDLSTGAVRRIPIGVTGSMIPLDEYVILQDRNRAVAVMPHTSPPTALLVGSNSGLVRSADPLVDYWVINQPDGEAGQIRLLAWQSPGFISRYLEAPAGSQLVERGGGGVLVLPPTGRTFRPTLAGFEIESEHRVIAEGAGIRIEQRCDDELECSIVAVGTVGPTAAVTDRNPALLPPDFVRELSDLTISGDGRWVLNDTSPARLLRVQTLESRLLGVGGYANVQWSDDSSSVMWLTTDRTPALVVVDVDEQQDVDPQDDTPWHVIELASLEANPSPGSTFVLDW